MSEEGVAAARLAAVSDSSTKKVDCPHMMASLAPARQGVRVRCNETNVGVAGTGCDPGVTPAGCVQAGCNGAACMRMRMCFELTRRNCRCPPALCQLGLNRSPMRVKMASAGSSSAAPAAT
jgi:hypothetical protein